MKAPKISEKSRKRGLKKSMLIRQKRSSIKKSLKKGEVNLKSLFYDKKLYDNYIANMRIVDLVCSLPGNGRVKAEKILEDLKINKNKKIGGLGKRQKVDFCNYFKIT